MRDDECGKRQEQREAIDGLHQERFCFLGEDRRRNGGAYPARIEKLAYQEK
jgi:hypothetical protein